MRIAIAAGGTGGHIYPGLAIAQEFLRRTPDARIVFLGSREGMEKDIIPRAGFTLQMIRARGLLRKVSYRAVSAPFVSLAGFFQAWLFLRNFRPRVLIATGGYASLPAALAARTLAVPVYLLEQNTLPGFVTRLISRWASGVFLSFAETKKYLPGIVTGNPVRREIIEADRERSRRALGFLPDEKVVLILGGSQGARSINEVMIGALPLLAKAAAGYKLKILHIVGSRDWDSFASLNYGFYRQVEYMYNIADAVAAADLAVSRAGATAISEFLVKGVPMVLVPFPYSAEGHQAENARVVAWSGAALIVNDGDLTPQKLAEVMIDGDLELNVMKENCKKLARPKAAEEIVDAIS